MKRRPTTEAAPAAEVSAAAEMCAATEVSAAAGATASTSAAAVITASLRLRDQGRAGKQREPIEFSFHDFDFPLFVCLNYFVNRFNEGCSAITTSSVSGMLFSGIPFLSGTPGATAPFVVAWKFFISRSSRSAWCV
jgi:hypothetical protein